MRALLVLLLSLGCFGCLAMEMIQMNMNKISRNAEVDRLIERLRAQAPHAMLRDANNEIIHLMAEETSRFHEKTDQKAHTAVEASLRAGEGSHTVEVVVGGQSRELIIDTGSGKTAFVCDGCDRCGVYHRNPPFKTTKQTQFLTCSLETQSQHECIECEDNKCKYGQQYVEGDYWVAYKASDELHFASDPTVASPIEFGCIFEQTGVFNQQSSDGIMGFSKHPDSIFEQFYRHKVTKSRIFSQCLAPEGGSLAIGGVDLSLNTTPFMYTPLRDTGFQYWTVSLESIEIGNTTVDVDNRVFNQDRGCVFDSGTTFMYFPSKSRDAFFRAWKDATGTSFVPFSDASYVLSDDVMAQLPSICFRFPHDAQMCVPPSQYFIEIAPNHYGGTFFFSDTAKSTIIGANALTNYNVIYDVENERIGMAPAKCDTRTTPSSMLHMVELITHPGGITFHRAIDWLLTEQYLAVGIAVLGILLVVVQALPSKSNKQAETTTMIPSPRANEAFDHAFFLFQD